MLYRKANQADVSAIAALHAESWRTAYRGAYRDEYLDGPVLEERTRVWQQRLAGPPPHQLVILAEDAHEAVGFVCAYGAEDAKWGTLLDNLHVLPTGQRRGIGRRLVSEVGAWCRSNHPDCGIYLWVLEQNERARSFYESMGAADRGGEVFEPPGGGQIRSRRYAWDRPQQVPPAKPS